MMKLTNGSGARAGVGGGDRLKALQVDIKAYLFQTIHVFEIFDYSLTGLTVIASGISMHDRHELLGRCWYCPVHE